MNCRKTLSLSGSCLFVLFKIFFTRLAYTLFRLNTNTKLGHRYIDYRAVSAQLGIRARKLTAVASSLGHYVRSCSQLLLVPQKGKSGQL